MKKIAIIGSFQKKENYQIMLDIIGNAASHDLTVLSPQGTSITDNRDGFVLFASDNIQLSNEKIQKNTIAKIIQADAIYVVNLDGYIGKTTCYEIGRIVERDIPIYFFDKPLDIPLCITDEFIISPEDFFSKVKLNHLSTLPDNCKICNKSHNCMSKKNEI